MTTLPSSQPSNATKPILKNFLPKTLFGRSLLIIITPVILLQGISLWIFYDRHWSNITGRLSQAVVSEINLVMELMAQNPSASAHQNILMAAQQTTGLNMSFLPNRTLPPRSKRDNSGLVSNILYQTLKREIQAPFRLKATTQDSQYEILLQLPDGLLKVVMPKRRVFSVGSYIFLLWMTGSALVLFTVALMFMRNQIRPIRRLAIAMDRFGKGRDVSQFRPQGATEVRQAAAAFQLMQERIQRQITQRTEMLAGVSHDLRTPLTRMQLQLALLPNTEDVQDLKADIKDMETMIDAYLAFAKGEGEETAQPLDLCVLVNEVAAGFQREGEALKIEMPQSLMIIGRPLALKRCLMNVLANAQRYAKQAWIKVTQQDQTVVMTVDDDGPGIPTHLREDVFRPFFRIESSRNPTTGGTGLGLTIARDIARSHGGDVVLGDSPHGGLRVTLTLPV